MKTLRKENGLAERRTQMRNTNKEFCEALRLMDRARNLQDKANDAISDCLNYLERHTEKFLRYYGTDLMYHMNLLEAIEDYISGDEYVADNVKTLEYDIKDAMNVCD
jgi:hypothetical protein